MPHAIIGDDSITPAIKPLIPFVTIRSRHAQTAVQSKIVPTIFLVCILGIFT